MVAAAPTIIMSRDFAVTVDVIAVVAVVAVV